VLRVEGQNIETTQVDGGLNNQDRVMIAIRPERISFASEGMKPNVLDCTVSNITFLGSIVRIQAAIGDASFNMDTFNRPSLEVPKIGDQVKVTFSREAVLVLGRS
jgi:ABC-type Fe3+/spermidine/putrescine transport system ATPase subunit